MDEVRIRKLKHEPELLLSWIPRTRHSEDKTIKQRYYRKNE